MEFNLQHLRILEKLEYCEHMASAAAEGQANDLVLLKVIKMPYFFSKLKEFSSFALGVIMLNILVIPSFLLASILGLLPAFAAPEKEEAIVEQGQVPVVPFAFRPELMATNSSPDPAGKKWVTLITTYKIEETFLKAIRFDFQSGNTQSMPTVFLIVNEQNIESGKNSKGEAEQGAKARVVLTLVNLLPMSRRAVTGEMITKANSVSFSISADKPLKVEIRNDQVAKIQNWTDSGNYFYREKEQGDLPAFKVSNLIPYKRLEGAEKDMSSEELRNLFKSQDK